MTKKKNTKKTTSSGKALKVFIGKFGALGAGQKSAHIGFGVEGGPRMAETMHPYFVDKSLDVELLVNPGKDDVPGQQTMEDGAPKLRGRAIATGVNARSEKCRTSLSFAVGDLSLDKLQTFCGRCGSVSILSCEDLPDEEEDDEDDETAELDLE